MVEVSVLISHGWFVLLLSLIVSLALFPLVVIVSFVYDHLVKSNPKTPKILLMLICTFIGVLIAALILEVYLGYTLPQLFSTG